MMVREFFYEIDCEDEDPLIVSYDVHELAEHFDLDIYTTVGDGRILVTILNGTNGDAREMLDELRKPYARVD